MRKARSDLENAANLRLIAKVEVVLELPLVQLQGEEIRHVLHHGVGGRTLRSEKNFNGSFNICLRSVRIRIESGFNWGTEHPEMWI